MRRAIMLAVFIMMLVQGAWAWELHYSPFADRSAAPRPQFGRAVEFDIASLQLDLRIDFEAESVAGTAAYTLSAQGKARSRIALDAMKLDVASVKAEGWGEVPFENTGERLLIDLDPPAEADVSFRLEIAYSVTRPERGLYFRTPRLGYEAHETQVWSQGQPEDSRYWFPSYDFPNQRMETAMRVTVPAGFRALSNGSLLDTITHPDGAQTFDWKLDSDHVTYLVSLVAGRFVEVAAEGAGVPLYYYVLEGQERYVEPTLGRTPAMMDYLKDLLQVDYPYSRYSQVVVTDFVAGGMENTAISTLHDSILHDESVGAAYTADWLVMHELIHQWFGDLVTCRDWSHLWLNEGFASYFEGLWAEHVEGVAALEHDLTRRANKIMAADSGDDRSPVIRSVYGNPNQLFDVRVYDKGAWVLHMLRRKLGDERFWTAVRKYLEAHRHQVVETKDLLRTFEEASGESLEQFFEQWLHKSGYPELKVDYEWDAEAGAVKLTVRQTQTVDERTPHFALDTAVVFAQPTGPVRHELRIEEGLHHFHIPLEMRPDWVYLDPDLAVLGKINFPRSKAMLIAQLEAAEGFHMGADALHHLNRFDGADTAQALGAVLSSDAFWGLRARAAEQLGSMNVPEAAEALMAWDETWDPRILRAVAEALGKHEDEGPLASLRQLAETAENPYVRSAALDSLVTLQADNLAPLLLQAAGEDSHRDVLRRAGFGGLAKLGERQHLAVLEKATRAENTRRTRAIAARALGDLGRWLDNKTPARRALETLLQDPNPALQASAARALGVLSDPRAIPALERHAATAAVEARETAQESIGKLEAAQDVGATLQTLRRDIEKQQVENQKLRERVRKLEQSMEELEKDSKDKKDSKDE